MIKVKRDLTGLQFGKWTVICQTEDFVGKDGKSRAQWLCECSCEKHTRKNVVGKYLLSGDSKSCGCAYNEQFKRKENGSKRGPSRKNNTYDLSGEFGVGYTLSGEEFWFDLEDYDLIKSYCWRYNSEGYLIAKDYNSNKTILLHRLIMNPKSSSMDVDHKQHPPRGEHKIDNRKQNLRIVPHYQNVRNRSVSSNNTSGATGVHWDQRMQRWIARIGVGGEKIYLGCFLSKQDAINARKEAEVKYFQEDRYELYNY